MAINVICRERWLTVFSPKHFGRTLARHFSRRATAEGDLIDCFDNPSQYKSSGDATGLFGDTRLSHPYAFQHVANEALNDSRQLVERVVNAPSTREELFLVVANLDKLSNVLCSVIDLAEFVRNAHPDPAWVEQANSVYESLCEYMNVLNTHAGLDESLQTALRDEKVLKSLSSEAYETARIFANDFLRSGVRLPPEKRSQFVSLSSEIITLGRSFLSNIPSPRSSVRLSTNEIKGIDWATSRFIKRELEVQTNSPLAHAILSSAKEESARKKIYIASKSSTEEQLQILENLLKTRANLAKLVGYSSFAAMSVEDKMAKTPEDVIQFLFSLAENIRPNALEAMSFIQQSKRQHMNGSGAIVAQHWDREYYIPSEAPGPGYPLPSLTIGTVFRVLSRLLTNLYGIHLSPIEPRPGELWHHNVQKLEVISDVQGTLGWIYTDLFNREGKGNGAAHYTVQCSRRLDAEDLAGSPFPRVGYGVRSNGALWQLPIVVLMCDFSHPTIEWYEVQTLFHEMGHAVHSMIGRTEYHNVSGTRCATDFVELPSILMEHFLTSPQVLGLFYEDMRDLQSLGPSLPTRIDKGTALDALHQIMLALLDQRYHSADVLGDDFNSTSVLIDLQNQYDVFPYAPGTSWQTQFGHLFSYGATYYSYLFDRAIASQIWSRLFAKNPLDREQGERFKTEVLQWGGAKDPWSMLAGVLSAPQLSEGGPIAMKEVGKWGVAEVGVAGQGIH